MTDTNWLAVAILAPAIGFVGMFSGGFWSVGCAWLIVPSALLFFDCTPMQAAGIGLLQMAPSIIGVVVRDVPKIGWGPGSVGRTLTLPAALGAVLTSFCGRPINAFFNQLCGAKALLSGFAVFMCFVGYKTLFGVKGLREKNVLRPYGAADGCRAVLGGLVAGVFSSVLGVGGAMVFRPMFANVFKTPELDTSRAVRLLLLITTVIGGATYLISKDGVDAKILVISALIALGGAVGFPLGARAHRIVVESGYATEAQRSFATICGIVVFNALLTIFDFKEASRSITIVVAISLFVLILCFTQYARRHPRVER